MNHAALHLIAMRRATGMSRAQMRAGVIQFLQDDLTEAMTDHLIALADHDTPPSGAPAMPAPPPVALLFEAVA
ncbi:hypothetical protein ACFSDD_11185 [Salipiger marinus]|uniref:hypothetical protein n=1 Tax=Salipiger marinus TaxID=555512 RepID=UPI001E618FE3|nr:hypothetical protein [Salipiger manganoxidans]MCD1619164.1 hypothetical protein [Salipiger manganoxidans]MEB3419935.1 hypothetical protein [Salipiger manganoxidans]